MIRLLCEASNGSFYLSEFQDDDIPPFAILSHTWGQDHEEVKYEDIMAGVGQKKPGYKKLLFCADQAKKDSLRYFWIDTCCINKSSSAELSEAINCMFRWYSEAVVCYVYLTDVSIESFEQDFSASRWFTRGWTLQELIAPKTVLFFASGIHIGDKTSLGQRLHEVTGIPVSVLQGKSTEDFSVAERMHWAAHRRTQRPEDAAYCLLGILDISLPVVYGEGHKKAMRRLRRELQFTLADMSMYGASLYEAVRRVKIDIVDHLLQDGVSVNYIHSDERRETILHAAVRSGSSEVLQSVLASKPILDQYSGEGLTPLMLAVLLGDEVAAALLLDARCEMELQFLPIGEQYTETIIMGDWRVPQGSTALIQAAENGHCRVVKLLLDRGAKINATANLHFTSLHAATFNDHLDCVRLLLEKGIDPEIRDLSGSTALLDSAGKGRVHMGKALLDAGANIEAEMQGGFTPLLEAAWYGRVEFAEFLINRGANPAARMPAGAEEELFDGATALHIAIGQANLDMIEALVRCGFPLNIKNDAGETAKEFAERIGDDELKKTLVSITQAVNSCQKPMVELQCAI